MTAVCDAEMQKLGHIFGLKSSSAGFVCFLSEVVCCLLNLNL